MDLFPEMSISASGLTAERVRLETIARNIANTNTTRTSSGEVFRRQLVTLMSQEGDEETPGGVQVAGIVEDPAPLRMVYQPGHPDANGEGMVAMPNVDLMYEMVDLLGASRSYEANLTVLQNTREMIRMALDI
jgi:flagellar basal-body rod protein FlgC